MNQHNDQTVTLMELAATFETCIDFLPPAGRKNISRAVEQLRTYGELCRASAGREAVGLNNVARIAKELAAVMGPVVPTCVKKCDGCAYEWETALRLIDELRALAKKAEGA